MAKLKRIPYDSLSLAAVAAELRMCVGGKLQRIVQPTDRTLFLGIYANGKEHSLCLSCSPTFARAHLSSQRPASQGEQPALGAALRKHADGARIVSIRQIGFDRILELECVRAEIRLRLIAELTGKHANLILVDGEGMVAAASHFVSAGQSARPILPGRPYSPPPFPLRNPIYDARNWDEFEDSEGGGPFLKGLLLAQSGGEGQDRSPESWVRMAAELRGLRETVQGSRFSSVMVEGYGAYPISVAALGYEEGPAENFSAALERHFRELEGNWEVEQLRVRLLGPLRRVLLAREVALSELRQAEETARNAARLQLMGELILAYAHTLEEGQTELETVDYESHPISIPLDPEMTAPENAAKFFDKAKRAKARAEHVHEQIARLDQDRIQLIATLRQAEDAVAVADFEPLMRIARDRRWLHDTSAPAKSAEERPFEGHRVRERLGPGGVRVLYGENATSNDYLTHRVARPNDIWLHVRGGTSAHVVIQTGNRPDRIGPEALRFAAEIAVQNSVSKHSSYVSVDYTLKKYVRKPRGAKPGMATYTHEKTLSVERRD